MCPPEQTIETGQIDLPKTLDHAHATALRLQIEAQRGGALTLYAQTCDFIGGAGAELLLAAQAEWIDAGHEFKVEGMSEKFVAGVVTLGLQHSTLFQEVSEE